MNECVFKTADLRRCVEHALKATEWQVGYLPEVDKPGLLFVHDRGVYLMSSGSPRDKLSGRGPSYAVYAAYADQCDPEKDADWWEASRARVGGDDFAEFIPIEETWLNLCKQHKKCIIKMESTSFAIEFE